MAETLFPIEGCHSTSIGHGCLRARSIDFESCGDCHTCHSSVLACNSNIYTVPSISALLGVFSNNGDEALALDGIEGSVQVAYDKTNDTYVPWDKVDSVRPTWFPTTWKTLRDAYRVLFPTQLPSLKNLAVNGAPDDVDSERESFHVTYEHGDLM